MNKSIFKNCSYNLSYQVLTLLIPIIVVPYVSRILGAEGIGIYSYTTATTQYFIMFGTIGMTAYAARTIAYERDNKEKMSDTFWAITFLKVITVTISLIMYYFLFCIKGEDKTVYLIQSVNIIATAVDIIYLFTGLEEFKKTVIRNTLVKIIGVICIFIFVKTYNDLYIYIFINVLMTFIGNLSMWLYLPKLVNKPRINKEDLAKHIKPSLEFFIPQIAIQIYTVVDRTMLGLLSEMDYVGMYEQSQKIIKIVIAVVTSIGTVMQPRMSNIFANGDMLKLKEYFNKSLKVVSYISIPMAFGIAAISSEFVTWFFGKGFNEVENIMIVLSPIIVFIALGNVFSVQYLISINKVKSVTVSSIVGLIVNVILNGILIPNFKVIGASIATVITEFTVDLVLYNASKDNVEERTLIKGAIKYIGASIIMFSIVRVIGVCLGVGIITTAVQCIAGVVVYVGLLLIVKEDISYTILMSVLNNLKERKSIDSR